MRNISAPVKNAYHAPMPLHSPVRSTETALRRATGVASKPVKRRYKYSSSGQGPLVKYYGIEGKDFTKKCHVYNFHAPILYYRFQHCLADKFDMEKQKNRSQLKQR